MGVLRQHRRGAVCVLTANCLSISHHTSQILSVEKPFLLLNLCRLTTIWLCASVPSKLCGISLRKYRWGRGLRLDGNLLVHFPSYFTNLGGREVFLLPQLVSPDIIRLRSCLEEPILNIIPPGLIWGNTILIFSIRVIRIFSDYSAEKQAWTASSLSATTITARI